MSDEKKRILDWIPENLRSQLKLEVLQEIEEEKKKQNTDLFNQVMAERKKELNNTKQ